MTAVDHRDAWTRPPAPSQAHLQHAPTTPGARPGGVSLEELRRAWAAVQAGDFRCEHRHTSAVRSTPTDEPPPGIANAVWTPGDGEDVLPVVACVGSGGASTLAVAIASTTRAATTRTTAVTRSPERAATNAGRPGWKTARVVECSSLGASGLAAASTSELGRHPSGWLRGTRDEVLLERVGGYATRPGDVPPPCPQQGPWPRPGGSEGLQLTVLDVGWALDRVLHEPSWLQQQLIAAEHVVLATTATVPGLRRLEAHLGLLADETAATVHAAVLGPRRRRWPRHLAHTLGPRTQVLDSDGRLTVVPHDRTLAVTGLGPAPLPAPLLSTAARLLDQTTTAAGGAPA